MTKTYVAMQRCDAEACPVKLLYSGASERRAVAAIRARTDELHSSGYITRLMCDEYLLHVRSEHSCKDVLPYDFYLVTQLSGE